MIKYFTETWLGDQLITSGILSDSEKDAQWLEHFKSDTKNSPNPHIRLKVYTLDVIQEEEFHPNE